MNAVIFYGSERRSVSFQSPQRLSVLLQLAGCRVEMPCGGTGKCGRCEIRVEGAVTPPDNEETARLGADKLKKGYRLACRTSALSDVTLRLPEQHAKIAVEGILPSLSFNRAAEGLGIAVDIGTTTLAAYLYRLCDGTRLAVESMANPQASYGADVITRLQKSRDGMRKALADAIRAGLNELFQLLLNRAGVPQDAVQACVLAGNTAMLYLLCAQRPESIIAAPFEQDRYFGEEVHPQELDLNLPEHARVYLARCISAYIGADITMSAMAAGLNRREQTQKPCVLIDIGTNGEMLLWKQGKLIGCSTAAGPTFEGAGIHMGMTAKTGAIAHITLQDGKFQYETIGDAAPVGICGSGIIDAVCVLLQAGVVDETGYMLEDGHDYEDCIVELDGQTAFRFPGTGVVVTAGDIRAVQLAKSAICAGLLTLLHHADCPIENVESLLLAGGFGNYMRISAAAQIGLIPPQLANKTILLGNAAGMGASMILLDGALRCSSEELSKEVETAQLASDPFFANEFMEQMQFASEL